MVHHRAKCCLILGWDMESSILLKNMICLLILWEVHTACFDHIYPPDALSNFFPKTHFMSFFPTPDNFWSSSYFFYISLLVIYFYHLKNIFSSISYNHTPLSSLMFYELYVWGCVVNVLFEGRHLMVSWPLLFYCGFL